MLTEFLSEENIALHKEYVRQLRLKFSIFESSIPALQGVGTEEISRLRLPKRDRDDALEFMSEISLHDIFFSSFLHEKYVKNESISRAFGSEAAYLNVLFQLCKNADCGFLTIAKNGDPSLVSSPREAFRHGAPILCIDLFEHAYFLDYGFDRERYLVLCLSHLDLTKLKS